MKVRVLFFDQVTSIEKSGGRDFKEKIAQNKGNNFRIPTGETCFAKRAHTLTGRSAYEESIEFAIDFQKRRTIVNKHKSQENIGKD